ncbi:type 1 glutamine amidotransferase domain-containing protein, partial [Arthrobacter stackebrandtii]
HGVMYDFADNQPLQEVARRIYEKGGIVAAVCHGVVGLLNIKLSDNSLLLKDRKVTGFSNIEEKLVELDNIVPFLTENELGGRGGVYSKHEDPWKPYVIGDGQLITGQNPASTALLADKVLAKLDGR